MRLRSTPTPQEAIDTNLHLAPDNPWYGMPPIPVYAARLMEVLKLRTRKETDGR